MRLNVRWLMYRDKNEGIAARQWPNLRKYLVRGAMKCGIGSRRSDRLEGIQSLENCHSVLEN